MSPKLLRYAERVVKQYDKNGSGLLEADEWSALGGKPQTVDADGDGRITIAELAQHAANFAAGRAIRLSTSQEPLVGGPPGQPGDPAARNASAAASTPAGDPRRNLKYFASLPAGVPPWFVERDTDGDGQLTLNEFSPKLLKADIDDFTQFDANRDGVLTAKEFLRAGKEAKSETDQ